MRAPGEPAFDPRTGSNGPELVCVAVEHEPRVFQGAPAGIVQNEPRTHGLVVHRSVEMKRYHILAFQRVQHVASPVRRLDEGSWSRAEPPVLHFTLSLRLAGRIQYRLGTLVLQAQGAAAIGKHAQFQTEPRVAAVRKGLDQRHGRCSGAAGKRGRAE